jgi:hypothetical protein
MSHRFVLTTATAVILLAGIALIIPLWHMAPV